MVPNETHQNTAHEAAAPKRYSNIYTYFVLAVFIFALIVAFIDRQIISLMVEPIKADLGINDTQMSLLQGLAFALFYSLLGLPIGRAADRYNRRNIILIGIFVWSIFTALCGLSKNYLALFAARVGVGAGEAALSPPAFSMIADYFPKERVSTAISIFQMGVALGVGFAMLFGGMIIDFADSLEGTVFPIVGAISSWRLVFILVAIPGLLALILMMFVKEPARRQAKGQASHLSLREAISYLKTRGKVMFAHLGGFSLLYMTGYGVLAWAPSYFIRTFGWSAGDASYFLGVVAIALGAGGTMSGGILVDRLQAKGMTDAPMRAGIICGIGLLLSATALFLSVGQPLMAQISVAALMLFSFAYLGFAPAALQLILPNHLRAQVSALFLLLVNVFGLGIGPTVVALFTDYVFGDPSYLKYSLPLAILLIVPIGMILLWRGLPHYRAEYQAINKG
jgi:MFS family permease